MRRPVLLLLLGGCTSSEVSSDGTVVARAVEIGEGVPDEARCAGCHPEAAATWHGSRHHSAFTNDAFARAWRDEPEQFCRDCHAPRAPIVEANGQDAAAMLAATERGIGCLDCHGVGDTLVTGAGTSTRDVPHSLVRADDFGTQSCARCHEFAFPEYSRRPDGTMMQTTMTEHRASAYADRSCASCHMPAGDDGHHDHSLGSSRTGQHLRDALAVVATREANTLIVTIEPRGIGHAFPTGDLFRRLTVHAELRDDVGLLGTHTRYLARHFAPYRRDDGTLDPAFHWPVPDDRIVGPVTLRLAVKTEAKGELRWWVDYERVASRDEVAPTDSSIESTVRVAEGTLP